MYQGNEIKECISSCLFFYFQHGDVQWPDVCRCVFISWTAIWQAFEALGFKIGGRWNAAIAPVIGNTFEMGAKGNGVYYKEGLVAMLSDPAIGGQHHQRCEISSNQESLFCPAWRPLVLAPSSEMKHVIQGIIRCARQ